MHELISLHAPSAEIGQDRNRSKLHKSTWHSPSFDACLCLLSLWHSFGAVSSTLVITLQVHKIHMLMSLLKSHITMMRIVIFVVNGDLSPIPSISKRITKPIGKRRHSLKTLSSPRQIGIINKATDRQREEAPCHTIIR